MDSDSPLSSLTFVVPENPISQQLQQFIAQHVHSVEQVEILCLLSDHPDKSWSVPEVFREVQSSEKSVAECLRKFTVENLVTQANGLYRLAPETRGIARELTSTYRERRVTVTEMIYRRPTAPIEDFAEAFRLKRKENE